MTILIPDEKIRGEGLAEIVLKPGERISVESFVSEQMDLMINPLGDEKVAEDMRQSYKLMERGLTSGAYGRPLDAQEARNTIFKLSQEVTAEAINAHARSIGLNVRSEGFPDLYLAQIIGEVLGKDALALMITPRVHRVNGSLKIDEGVFRFPPKATFEGHADGVLVVDNGSRYGLSIDGCVVGTQMTVQEIEEATCGKGPRELPRGIRREDFARYGSVITLSPLLVGVSYRPEFTVSEETVH